MGEPRDARRRGVDPGDYECTVAFPALGALACVCLCDFVSIYIVTGVGKRDWLYFGRPARWAGEVEFVADGAAETAAGDGICWRHG